MGNLTSTSNVIKSEKNKGNQKEILAKIEQLLGGSDTENFSKNELNEGYLNKIQQLLQTTETNNFNAVSGNTETLHFTENNKLNMTAGTSENLFTQTENLVPVLQYNNLSETSMDGGDNEMNVNEPYYKEYRDMKNLYLLSLEIEKIKI